MWSSGGRPGKLELVWRCCGEADGVGRLQLSTALLWHTRLLPGTREGSGAGTSVFAKAAENLNSGKTSPTFSMLATNSNISEAL